MVSLSNDSSGRSGLLLHALEVCKDAVEINILDGTIVYANQAWKLLFLGNKQEVVGARWDSQHLHDVDQEELKRSWTECLNNGKSEGVFRLSHKEDSSETILYDRVLYKNAIGDIIAIITVYRSRADFLTAREVFYTLTEALSRSNYAVAIADSFGFLVDVNQEFIGLTGYQRDEIPRLHLKSLFPKAIEIPFLIEEGNSRWEGEVDLILRDDKKLPVSLRMISAGNAEETIVCFLVEKSARVDTISEYHSTQIMNLEHELRNALTGIIGIDQIAVRDPTLQRRLAIIESSAKGIMNALKGLRDIYGY